MKNNSLKKIDYKKGKISVLATNLLEGEYSDEHLISETKALLSWIKSIYPEDYMLYINSKFNDINNDNVRKILRRIIIMCTANEL